MGPEDRAPVAPLGSPSASLARPAGPLLPPGLLATSRHLPPGLGLVSSLSCVGLLAYHRLVEQCRTHLDVEKSGRQAQLPDGLARLVVDGQSLRRHDLAHRFLPGCRRESCTRTTLLVCPGTAPETMSRLRPASTVTTRRCWLVRLALPRWPA